MRAITMTVAEANAILDGENQWITRRRGSDILPPSVSELVAIHESVDYPDFVDPLVKTNAPSAFSGQIVAVAKAGQWKYTGSGNYHFSLLEVKRLTSPIPAVGGFGFWRVELGIETRIWNDLGEPMPMVRG